MKAREYNIQFHGTPGLNNAITDVKGVEVGHSTIIEGDGKLIRGKGPIRTGVTAIFPRGKSHDAVRKPVYGAYYSLNGNGELTGIHWIDESGFVNGPIMLTNTHSVGSVHKATIEYILNHENLDEDLWSLPVVGETWDGFLNDINGFHVKNEHVFEALNNAKTGPVEEGNVGGGTGMICHQFKGGIGTSSRIVNLGNLQYTIGVIVQANYGYRRALTISGVPIGAEITDLMPAENKMEKGSIIVIVATDAPFLPHQLKRIAKRVPMGIARVGGFGGNSSGDIFLAFSTANPNPYTSSYNNSSIINQVESLDNSAMDHFFESTMYATEEAIVNAMFAAETMVGRDNNIVYKIPINRVLEVMKSYNHVS